NAQSDAGTRLFPLRLERVDRLGPAAGQEPDLVVAEHPILRIFAGTRSPFLAQLKIDQFVRGQPIPNQAGESVSQILAETRSGQPYIVEVRRGAGQVVVCCGTLSPTWNNWATQPTFVVWLLELQSYLDSQRSVSPDAFVGEPIVVRMPADDFLPDATLWRETWTSTDNAQDGGGSQDQARGSDRGLRSSDGSSAPSPPGPTVLHIQPPTLDNKNVRTWTLHESDSSRRSGIEPAGVVSLRLARADGEAEVRRLAVNVDPRESDLRLRGLAPLARSFARTNVRILSAEAMAGSSETSSGFAWSEILLYALIALLVGEQLLAYATSYHPTPRSLT
ncbi:MAG TPA: hypothetical protein VIY86_12670, partial [Pirellulaceae bacterium]